MPPREGIAPRASSKLTIDRRRPLGPRQPIAPRHPIALRQPIVPRPPTAPREAAPRNRRIPNSNNIRAYAVVRRIMDKPIREEFPSEAKLKELLKDVTNPFELSNEMFREFYHFDRLFAHRLIFQTSKYISTPEIPVVTRIFAALHFFAHGRFDSQFSRIFRNKQMENVILVANAIRKMAKHYVKFPDVDEYGPIKEKFLEKTNFPDCIGALDCYQIRIKKPKSKLNRDRYLNKDGYYSMSMQLVTDFNLRILQADCSNGGATNDANIWDSSVANEAMRRRYEEAKTENKDTFVLADSRYKLRPWVLVPCKPVLAIEDELFNNALATARNCCYRVIRLLKHTFRCMSLLDATPQEAEVILEACIILHNMMVEQDLFKNSNDYEDMQYKDQHSHEKQKHRGVQCWQINEGSWARNRVKAKLAPTHKIRVDKEESTDISD